MMQTKHADRQTHVTKGKHFSETRQKAWRECVIHDASETTGPRDHPSPSKHVHTGRGILKEVSGERLFSLRLLQGTDTRSTSVTVLNSLISQSKTEKECCSEATRGRTGILSRPCSNIIKAVTAVSTFRSATSHGK